MPPANTLAVFAQMSQAVCAITPPAFSAHTPKSTSHKLLSGEVTHHFDLNALGPDLMWENLIHKLD